MGIEVDDMSRLGVLLGSTLTQISALPWSTRTLTLTLTFSLTLTLTLTQISALPWSTSGMDIGIHMLMVCCCGLPHDQGVWS